MQIYLVITGIFQSTEEWYQLSSSAEQIQRRPKEKAEKKPSSINRLTNTTSVKSKEIKDDKDGSQQEHNDRKAAVQSEALRAGEDENFESGPSRGVGE